MNFFEKSNEIKDYMIDIRRRIHENPELAFDLEDTTNLVKEELDKLKISYTSPIENSVLASLGAGDKTILLRADMDALPVAEETGLEFASTHPGQMHACGHDSHTAIALTAAKIINENKDKLKGSVKFIFQPGEEIPGGAKPMIEEGVLENPKVDFIVGMHGGHLADVPRGSIAFKENEMMAAMDKFTIEVNGKGGHGASPHAAVDPIIISAEILLGLQKIISREIAPVDSAVVSVCKIDGGFTQNIIPDKVNMMGTSRALDEDVRDIVEKRISEICESMRPS